MNVFCDLDGVLVDFDGGFLNTFGVSNKGLKPSDMWKMIGSKGEDYWVTLPPIEGYMELWRFLEPYYPTILTGLPINGKIAKSGKKRWCFRNLPGCWNFSATNSSEKQFHLQEKGDILIDDRLDNCERWNAVGGRSVHFTSIDSTLTQLKDWNLIQKANSFNW